jgi:hypothetical protein
MMTAAVVLVASSSFLIPPEIDIEYQTRFLNFVQFSFLLVDSSENCNTMSTSTLKDDQPLKMLE